MKVKLKKPEIFEAIQFVDDSIDAQRRWNILPQDLERFNDHLILTSLNNKLMIFWSHLSLTNFSYQYADWTEVNVGDWIVLNERYAAKVYTTEKFLELYEVLEEVKDNQTITKE